MSIRNIIDKMIRIFSICTCTVVIGIFIASYIIITTDFSKYVNHNVYEVVK